MYRKHHYPNIDAFKKHQEMLFKYEVLNIVITDRKIVRENTAQVSRIWIKFW